MGIQLPVLQEVNGTYNATLHQRNRSLDSALQRIPEIDVCVSPEGEGITMLPPEARCCPVAKSISTSKTQRDELASLGSDDSGILCGSEAGSTDTNTTRESSVDYLTGTNNQSRESLTSNSDPDLVRSAVVECKQSEPVGRTELVNITTTNRITQINIISETPKPSSGMLRLLESEVFSVSMAIHYLFNSKEPGVQSYIANKLFTFEDSEVDFYLPQLVCMYIQMQDVAEVIHPYLINR